MGQVTIASNVVDIFGLNTEADIYFDTSIRGTVYLAASTEDKDKALVSATRWLIRLGLIDDSGDTIVPSLADTGVPVAVQEGTYELAQILLDDVDAASNATTGSNVKKVKAGSTDVTFFRATDGTVLPTVALQLVQPYLSSQQSESSSVGACASGTGDTSAFEDIDAWGRIIGYP